MKKYLLKKALVFTMFVLFIGASLVSAVDINLENQNDEKKIIHLNINDGLVGYWSFDLENAEDESGNGNSGIVYGATLVDGISGRAFQFDGVDDYIDILDTGGYEFTNQDLTFSAWVQIADNDNHYHAFMSLADGTTQYGYPIIILSKCRSGYREGRIYFQLQTSLDEALIVPSNEDGDTLPKFEWIYLTGVIDYPDSVKFYVNGDLQGSVTPIDFDMSDALSLKLNFGSTPYPGYNGEYGRHNGRIDEVRIYDRALSDDEIKELYNNPAGLKKTIMFGRISNLTTDVGNLTMFKALRLRCIQFSPFRFYTTAGETIKISEDYRGLLTKNIVFGIFQSNI